MTALSDGLFSLSDGAAFDEVVFCCSRDKEPNAVIWNCFVPFSRFKDQIIDNV